MVGKSTLPLSAGDRVMLRKPPMIRQRRRAGQAITGVIERVLDPLHERVVNLRVLLVRFDDGEAVLCARNEVGRIEGEG